MSFKIKYGAIRSEVFPGGRMPLKRTTRAAGGSLPNISVKSLYPVMPAQDSDDCVANSWCMEGAVVHQKQTGQPFMALSRRQTYFDGRRMQGDITRDASFSHGDNGLAASFMAEVMKEWGVARESVWGYGRGLFTEPDFHTQWDKAGRHLSDYAWLCPKDGKGNPIVNPDGTWLSDYFLSCLTGQPIFGDDNDVGFGHGFPISLLVWNDLAMDGNGVVPEPPANVSKFFGHCVIITGYTVGKGWQFLNPWGAGYGDHGFGHLSPGYMKPQWAIDACALGKWRF